MKKLFELQGATFLTGISYFRGTDAHTERFTPIKIPKNHKLEIIIKRNYLK